VRLVGRSEVQCAVGEKKKKNRVQGKKKKPAKNGLWAAGFHEKGARKEGARSNATLQERMEEGTRSRLWEFAGRNIIFVF